MGKLFATDISEINEFTRKCFQYKKIREDKERHRAVFSVTNPSTNSISCYEVWIGIKHINPDGTVVYAKPGSELWGQTRIHCRQQQIRRSNHRLPDDF